MADGGGDTPSPATSSIPLASTIINFNFQGMRKYGHGFPSGLFNHTITYLHGDVGERPFWGSEDERHHYNITQ
ncbi:hypothetical protein IC582_003203 [Cucumis melo]